MTLSSEKKSGTRPLFAICVCLFAMFGAAAAVWLSQNASAESSLNKPKLEKEGPPTFIALEPFTVNLYPKKDERFLQVSYTVQVANEEQAALFKLYMPEVRSRSILIFSGKKAADISTVDGKEQLSRELLAELNEPFKAVGTQQMVKDIYFTSFLIQ
jgi:flagellar FliL protein